MSNNTNKVNNPMKVITGPDTRWSYANVWEPSPSTAARRSSASASSFRSPTPRPSPKIKAAIEAAYHEGEAKLKGNGKTVPPLAASRRLCATAIQSVRMIPLTPMLTSSTPTPLRLPASWMLTAIPS
jgi:hypothetical protein